MPRIDSILFSLAGSLVLVLVTGCGGPVTPRRRPSRRWRLHSPRP